MTVETYGYLYERTMERLSVCIAGHTKGHAFKAGSVVNGDVILFLDKAKKVDKVNVSFSGKSYIFVSEYEQELMKEKCSHADSDQEQIIDLSTTLWNGCIHQSLEAGTHNFPFSIQLPESLPSSFQLNSKDLHGCHIIYTLKATVIRPKKKSYRTEMPITITNEPNINDPSFASMQCVSGKKEKSGIHRYFPTSGHVTMEVTTNHNGYHIGDSIAISVDIENTTKGKISSLRAALVRNIMHRDHCHDNYRLVIKKIKNDGSQTIVHLCVPKTSPSIINFDMIKVTYKLEVKLKMSNNIKLMASLPITIGSISPDECVAHERSQFAELTEDYLSKSSSADTLSLYSSSDCLNLI